MVGDRTAISANEHKGSEFLVHGGCAPYAHVLAVGDGKVFAVGAELEEAHLALEVEVRQHHALVEVHQQCPAI